MKYTQKFCTAVGTAALAALVAAAPAQAADTPAYSSTGGFSTFDGPFVVGFSFTALTDMYVTALGYYDIGGDGLATTHDIGLYAGNSLLTSVSVSGGNAASAIDGYQYASITPYFLSGGSQYTLAGVAPANSDGYLSVPYSGTVTSSFISISPPGLYANGGVLTQPTTGFVYSTYASPNMLVSAVPEPSTYALMLAGLGFVGWSAKRRRDSNS